MKIIDLLNKIANGEEVPEKFKFAGQIFKKKGSYIEDEDGDSIFASMFTDFSNINGEVEVIEEDKKIEKIDMFDYFTGYDFGGTNKELLRYLELNFSSINDVLNKVINKVNELENK